MARKNNNIIEINGQRYNATTGKAVGVTQSPKAVRTIDGIVGQHPKTHQASVQASPTTAQPIKKLQLREVTRQPAKGLKHHAPESAHTLMRHAVSKPEVDHQRHLKAQSRTDALVKQPTVQLAPKLSALSVDTKRLRHARAIAKSQLISRFNLSALAGAPATRPTHLAAAPAAVSSKPVNRREAAPDMFQQALQHATSHQQPAVKIKRTKRGVRRIAGISAAAMVFLLLIGVATYLNLGNIKLRLAASKAGFAASLPAYNPAGYSLGDVSSKAGTVAAHFHSNSGDDRAYTVTERPSEWNSVTLRDMFVVNRSPYYQAVETGGRTIYLYDTNAATWVSNGIWYQVQGNGSLSNQQLIDLAGSL